MHTLTFNGQPFIFGHRYKTAFRMPDGNVFTLSFETSKKTGIPFDLSVDEVAGTRFSVSGSCNGSGGQIIDQLEEGDELAQRVAAIWRRWHLNDLRQRKHVSGWLFEPMPDAELQNFLTVVEEIEKQQDGNSVRLLNSEGQADYLKFTLCGHLIAIEPDFGEEMIERQIDYSVKIGTGPHRVFTMTYGSAHWGKPISEQVLADAFSCLLLDATTDVDDLGIESVRERNRIKEACEEATSFFNLAGLDPYDATEEMRREGWGE